MLCFFKLVYVAIGYVTLSVAFSNTALAQVPNANRPREELSVQDIIPDSAAANFMIRFRVLAPMQRAVTIIAEAREADAAGKYKMAADKFAWAILATRTYALRDSIEQRLHHLVRTGAWGVTAAAKPDSAITFVLDSLYKVIYDRDIPVTRSTVVGNTRLVFGEYVSGTQCGPCWQHDRAFSALLQRYSPEQLVVVAYHDGPGQPIARPLDSLWKYVGGNVWERKVGDTSGQELYKMPGESGGARMWDDWIDGVATNNLQNDYQETATDKYQRMSASIDARLQRAPGAEIAMVVTPIRDAKGVLQTLQTTVTASTSEPRSRVGVRLILVQDTTRVIGYTPRRLQYMAARAVAWFGNRRLFHPLPAKSLSPSTIKYTFDIAALQSELLRSFDEAGSDNEARVNFPSRADWLIDTDRLGVIAVVQDQETLEVLQTMYQPLRTAAAKAHSNK